MKKLGILKKLLLIVMVFSIAVLSAGIKSSKAVGVLDLTNIQDIETWSSSSSTSSSTSNTGSTGTTSASTTATTGTTKTSTSTSTPSKDSKLPKTGSNKEIVYGIGLVALIGAVAYVYKKSTIKLK